MMMLAVMRSAGARFVSSGGIDIRIIMRVTMVARAAHKGAAHELDRMIEDDMHPDAIDEPGDHQDDRERERMETAQSLGLTGHSPHLWGRCG